VTAPAWHTKPSWYIVASEDRVISPELEAMMAETIHAETEDVDEQGNTGAAIDSSLATGLDARSVSTLLLHAS
jgi:hypothetical protein